MIGHIPITPQERQHLEAILLGSLLLHPDAGSVVKDVLHLHDFSEGSHRLLYETLMTVIDTPELVTVEVICMLLTQNELERLGGIPYLMLLQQQAQSASMPVEEQVRHLRLATLHHLLDRLRKALHTHAGQSGGDLAQLAGDLEQAIQSTERLFPPKSHLPPPLDSLQADLETYLGDLEARRRQRTAFTGIPTGFADLDTLTGGLQRSDLIVVAGPPSVGKTSFALSIALHVLLKERRSVALFSLEAPKRQVIGRLLAMEAHLDQQLLRSLTLEAHEWERLAEAGTVLSGAHLWINDTANLSTEQLHDQAHLLVERCGVQLLIVDYVHLMRSSINDRRHENRVQEIGEISRSLKALARELDLPVLALAQVSRVFESRSSKKLHLSDLRDGSLENDADLVLFLSMSEAEIPGAASAPRLATISIAKHRHGPRADLDICYLPDSTRFRDLSTLSQPSVSGQLPSAAPAPAAPQVKHLPRLEEILAQAVQARQRPGPLVKLGERRRALPLGTVLEDDERDDEAW